MPNELYVLQIAANFLAIFLGPVTAVCITLWAQSRKDKKAAKRHLFLTLMGERKRVPLPPHVLAVLNTIDVVFYNNRQVVDLWHKYYMLLGQPPAQEREHTWLELLAAMAVDLRYPALKQTDIDKFYVPQGYIDQIELQGKIQNEFLRVLQNTASLVVKKKEDVET
jgi:hypothetical protein